MCSMKRWGLALGSLGSKVGSREPEGGGRPVGAGRLNAEEWEAKVRENLFLKHTELRSSVKDGSPYQFGRVAVKRRHFAGRLTSTATPKTFLPFPSKPSLVFSSSPRRVSPTVLSPLLTPTSLRFESCLPLSSRDRTDTSFAGRSRAQVPLGHQPPRHSAARDWAEHLLQRPSLCQDRPRLSTLRRPPFARVRLERGAVLSPRRSHERVRSLVSHSVCLNSSSSGEGRGEFGR